MSKFDHNFPLLEITILICFILIGFTYIILPKETDKKSIEISKEIDNSDKPVTRIIDIYIEPSGNVTKDYDLINISIDLSLSKKESPEEITRQVFNMLKFLNTSPFISGVGELKIKGYTNDEKTEHGWIYHSNNGR